MNKIVWSRRALFNLQAIRDYIAQFNPFAADKVADEIIATGEQLALFPGRGRMVPGKDMREMMTSYPYVIRYRIAGDQVIILRIRHMARGS